MAVGDGVESMLLSCIPYQGQQGPKVFIIKKNWDFSGTFWIIQIYFSDSGRFLCVNAYFGASINLILFFVSNHAYGKQETW